jgi:hypothetical protein
MLAPFKNNYGFESFKYYYTTNSENINFFVLSSFDIL